MTTHVLTFRTSVTDENERRANLNRLLKVAKRSCKLRLVMMKTTHEEKLAPKQSRKNPARRVNRAPVL